MEIIAGGGSPCQGLSKLSCERQGLEDAWSKLFFVLADRLAELERLAKARGLWFIGFVENVVCDDADRGRMAPWRRPTLGYLQVGHGQQRALDPDLPLLLDQSLAGARPDSQQD